MEVIVGGHAMRPLSMASYDVLLRTGNPLVKGEDHGSWIEDRGSRIKSVVPLLPSTFHNPRSSISPPCDEPGFLAAQVFAIAAETGWPEERILFMPLARLFQYQHCLLRRNGVRAC